WESPFSESNTKGFPYIFPQMLSFADTSVSVSIVMAQRLVRAKTQSERLEANNKGLAQMNKRIAAAVSIIALGSFALQAGRPAHGRALIDAPESAYSPTAQDRPAEELSKNIQVLKGLPASRMLTVMHLMRTALGVRCDYCHVAELGKYWMDDKPPKQV